MSQNDPIARRRTFAIISHPDAGKTTLTEKLLLHGGAIQLAGEVKARGERRRTRSDWMKVEQERGISVSASVMTYEYGGCIFNLLDTPGHEDFSEDTYRTLTAVDSALMVIDCAKGVEERTIKLMEVCRLRDVPIVTFINKIDREGLDPFQLMDEIESTLQLDITPFVWPIGMGQRFHGAYDLRHDRLLPYEREGGDAAPEAIELQEGLEDPGLAERLADDTFAQLVEEAEMARELCPKFDHEAYLEGNMTPVFFGSALRNFGVRSVLDSLAELAPSPRPQTSASREVDPREPKVSGFVFKIQANMDPKHRDRIAFMRLCSGRFRRGMKLRHVRSGKTMAIHNPLLFLARDRELAEEAWAGDILGLPNHGNLRIGDTLTEGEDLRFTGVPSFAPELLQTVRPVDPMRAKHLGKALFQLAEEGAAQAFRTRIGSRWVIGVAGALQFEVLADRLRTEYSLDVSFASTTLVTARWVETDDPKLLQRFIRRNEEALAEDHNGHPVFLARNHWHLNKAAEDWPEVKFLKTMEQLR